MRSRFQDRRLVGFATVLVIASLGAIGLPAIAQTSSPDVPENLPARVDALDRNLTQIAEAQSLEDARAAHTAIEPLLPRTVPHVVDLADNHGALFETLLDELGNQLAAGNLSDARSLAQAAVNTLRDDITLRVDRWDANRTALAPGPLRRTGDDLRVALVLLNPPPAGIGAVDARLDTGNATPLDAWLATGQGEASIDPGNRTARVATFDPGALARLDASTREQVVLGEVRLDPSTLAPGDRLQFGVHVEALADAEGGSVLALGLERQAVVPAAEEGIVPGLRWWAVGGLLLGAGGVVMWIQRWEL